MRKILVLIQVLFSQHLRHFLSKETTPLPHLTYDENKTLMWIFVLALIELERIAWVCQVVLYRSGTLKEKKRFISHHGYYKLFELVLF